MTCEMAENVFGKYTYSVGIQLLLCSWNLQPTSLCFYHI